MTSSGSSDLTVPAGSAAPGSSTAAATPAAGPSGDVCFPVGQSVRLAQRPPYLKSADPMPMLRPPDLIDGEEWGVVVELRAQDLRAVRFRRGTFLLSAGQLRAADPPADASPPESL